MSAERRAAHRLSGGGPRWARDKYQARRRLALVGGLALLASVMVGGLAPLFVVGGLAVLVVGGLARRHMVGGLALIAFLVGGLAAGGRFLVGGLAAGGRDLVGGLADYWDASWRALREPTPELILAIAIAAYAWFVIILLAVGGLGG